MNLNNNILSKVTISANAGGKAILIGEHSVVYGHKAIAMALPDVRLQMKLCAPDIPLESWDHAWSTIVKGKKYEPEIHIKKLLIKAFEKALSLCKVTDNIYEYTPQVILVESEIPLGGGMGGSAAISTCFLKIAAQIALQKNIINEEITMEKQIEFANEIDCLFHFGKASGLDVTAVASDGMIEFIKGEKHKYIKNEKEFWLALIDSQERSETSLMVKKVALKLEESNIITKDALDQLGKLANDCVQNLTSGNLNALAKNLNCAQDYLNILGVSTHKINNIVDVLKNEGALAAKLTGAGGGGLVMGIFESHPKQLYSIFNEECLFITRVPKYGKRI